MSVWFRSISDRSYCHNPRYYLALIRQRYSETKERDDYSFCYMLSSRRSESICYVRLTQYCNKRFFR